MELREAVERYNKLCRNTKSPLKYSRLIKWFREGDYSDRLSDHFSHYMVGELKGRKQKEQKEFITACIALLNF